MVLFWSRNAGPFRSRISDLQGLFFGFFCLESWSRLGFRELAVAELFGEPGARRKAAPHHQHG